MAIKRVDEYDTITPVGSEYLLIQNPPTHPTAPLKYYKTTITSVGSTSAGAVSSVAGKTGTVTLTKSDVGLANVDNTSDVNKPVSTAQAAADALKANITGQVFTGAISATNLSGTNTGDQDLSSYATSASVTTGLAGKANTTHTHIESDITGLTSDLAAKQATLVSGTNLKTVNGNSLLGSGDLTIVSGGGAATNLSQTLTSTTVGINSDTGADIVIAAADTTNAGVMTVADRTKLTGIATGATANSPDATLLARANHTGTQTASTISDFSTAADARITAATGVSVQAFNANLTAFAAKTAPTGTVVGTTDTQTVTNKTLDNTTSLTIKGASLILQDATNTAKQAQLSMAGITPGQTRILTIPDASTTIVGHDVAQTLTNKTLTAPVISTITNTGTLTLPTTTGTIALTSSNITGTAAGITGKTNPTGVLVGTTDTQTLTNKDISSTTNIFPSGFVVQIQATNFSAVATGTATIPLDDTPPQITEGTEFMTQTITPKSATNRLNIEARIYGSHSAITDFIGALFQDTTASALAANAFYAATATGENSFTLSHDMVAGTTSVTTFRVRVGGSTAGTFTFNGRNGTRNFGGITLSSIKVTEYKP